MIRDLTLKDVPDLRALLWQTQVQHATENPDRYRAFDHSGELTALLVSQMSAPGVIAIGLEDAEGLAGYLLATVSEIGPKGVLVPRAFAMLTEIAVRKDRRRQGVANRLLDELVHRAKSQGLTMIRAAHADFNTASAAMLERHVLKAVSTTRELCICKCQRQWRACDDQRFCPAQRTVVQIARKARPDPALRCARATAS